MTTPLPNEILIRHSLWEWIRIFDRMRSDRYTFLQPAGKYVSLEESLKIKTFMPENDRNSILVKTIANDAQTWARPLNYTPGVIATPAHLHEGSTWTEKYPEIHGQNNFSVPEGYNTISYLTNNNAPWSQIIRAIYYFICQFNGYRYADYNAGQDLYYDWFVCNQKYCYKHEGVTPIGPWKEDETTGEGILGCWQEINRRNFGPYSYEMYISSTYTARLRIKNFPSPVDLPYRIVLAGYVDRFSQFDGMGFVEYPGCYNVIFDSGIIQGNYTSPLIGLDSIYTSTDLDYFQENNITGYAGWRIRRCNLFVLPAEGTFPDYF